jgi:5-methylcytosine-specific restriction endonuclease McrA
MFEHRKRRLVLRDPLKTCLKCGASKDVYTDFYWFTSKGKTWPSGKCKICHGECQAKYRQKNAEKYASLARVWRANNPEKTRIIQANANARNGKARKKKYLSTPNGAAKQRFYNKLRRCNRLKATTPESFKVTAQWFEKQKTLQNHRCAYCKKEKPLTVEHMLPITRGGKHICENIVAVCKSCNSSKHNKTLLEWKPQLSLTDKEGLISQLNSHG